MSWTMNLYILKTIKWFATSLILFACPLLYSQAIMDMAGASNGTTISATNLNNASHCKGTAAWSVNSVSTTHYSNTLAPAQFASSQYCSGTGYSGSATLSIAWDTTANDVWGLAMSGTSAKMTEGFFIKFNPVSVSNGDFSDHQQMGDSGGNENLTVALHKDSGGYFISIEDSGGSVTGGTQYYGKVYVDTTQWLWITGHWVNGGPHQFAVYYAPSSGSSMGAQLTDSGCGSGCRNGSGATLYMNNIPSFSLNGQSIWFGKQGSQGPGFGTTYFGDILFDPTGAQYPLLPTGYWSGIVAPQRAANWNTAGLLGMGGVPSSTWTQCGSTIAAYTGSASTINSALSSCANSSQYVLLGPGTFSLSSVINFPSNTTGKLVLRGSGTAGSATTLSFQSGVSASCGTSGFAVNGYICAASSDGTFPNSSTGPSTTHTITSGLRQGSGQVILNSVSGITQNQTVLVFDQCDSGMSGSANAACTGTSTDNGALFLSSAQYSGGNGGSNNGPDTGNGWLEYRFEQEEVQAATISGTTVTLSRPIDNPDWASARTPLVWFFNPMPEVGIENLIIDGSNDPQANGAALVFAQTINSWVKNVEFKNPPLLGFECIMCVHNQVESNYFFATTATTLLPAPHAYDAYMGSDNLIWNNIIQQNYAPMFPDGPDNGSVYAYNFVINMTDFISSTSLDGMSDGIRFHSTGDNYTLQEGNVIPNINWDDTHGPIVLTTSYRNFIPGWESCANSQCGTASSKGYHTDSILSQTFARYNGWVGNVLGTPGVITHYQSVGADQNFTIYTLGAAGSVTPSDSLVNTTGLRWGNYDNVTAAVRWCGTSSDTGWSTTCGSTTEVPSAASGYPNFEPVLGGSSTSAGPLPASFFITARPSWWSSSIPFPAIGPDVTGGNIGQCSGTPNTSGKYNGVAATASGQCAGSGISTSAWAGHANAIPAMNCYLNVMGGAPDGTGNALTFNPSACYAASSNPTPGNAILTAIPL